MNWEDNSTPIEDLRQYMKDLKEYGRREKDSTTALRVREHERRNQEIIKYQPVYGSDSLCLICERSEGLSYACIHNSKLTTLNPLI